jgi:hypothetical protein
MTEIKVEINNCDQCPHSKVSRVYTPDSFETVRKIHCNALDETVYSYLDWYDKSPIPARCPKRVKPKLEDLVKDITEENRHEELFTDRQGKELI